jgi:hypothetical protein
LKVCDCCIGDDIRPSMVTKRSSFVHCSVFTMTTESMMNEDEKGEQTGTTRQTQRDRDEVKRRRSQCPEETFQRMRMALLRQSKIKLLNDCVIRSNETKCPQPDRLCRRHREALICWFCEFWPSRVHPIVADMTDIDWMTCNSTYDDWFGSSDED